MDGSRLTTKQGRWVLTGGAGYIGAHVAMSLLRRGFEVVVVDNLSTGIRARLPERVHLIEADILSVDFRATLSSIDNQGPVEGVIHLAAKKSVPESVSNPLFYYEQNVCGTVALLRAMESVGISRIVYSSSAAVYGGGPAGVLAEDALTVPSNPYGDTKLGGELAVRAYASASNVQWAALRYFNVVGAAASALADTGRTNLVPRAVEAAESGTPLTVFGGDWPTSDGTCVRDYIHVQDLADAHVATVQALRQSASSLGVMNVGRGEGLSVLEVVRGISRALGREVPYSLASRREGDAAEVVADPSRISSLLGWSAKFGPAHMFSLPTS